MAQRIECCNQRNYYGQQADYSEYAKDCFGVDVFSCPRLYVLAALRLRAILRAWDVLVVEIYWYSFIIYLWHNSAHPFLLLQILQSVFGLKFSFVIWCLFWQKLRVVGASLCPSRWLRRRVIPMHALAVSRRAMLLRLKLFDSNPCVSNLKLRDTVFARNTSGLLIFLTLSRFFMRKYSLGAR